MFIYHELGHKGPTSFYPCPFCFIPREALERAGEWDYKKKYPDRTIEDYKNAAETCQPSTSKGRKQSAYKRRIQSLETMSVDQAPLFHIPVGNISPPQLHIALGVGKALFESLEECCLKRDLEEEGIMPSKSAKDELNRLLEKKEESETRIEEWRVKVAQTQTLYKAFVMAQKFPQNPAQRCEGIVCLFESHRAVSENSDDLVSCYECGREYHFACETISTQFEIEAASDGTYKCLRCNGDKDLSDVINEAKLKAETIAEKLSRMLNAHEVLEAEVNVAEEIVLKKSGRCTKRLAQALKNLGVDRRAHYAGTFVGNHIHKMVTGDGPSQLAAALGDESANRDKYKTLFTGLGNIQQYCRAEFLTDAKISGVEKSCEQFASDMKRLLPEESVTPKMHFLATHLPAFARRHRTLGMLSEQSLESLHAKVNAIERKFAAFRDERHQMIAVYQDLHVMSSV
uniref:Zinc finger PHD-type domain-containing protein n=1 Tax=Plectus sambesii TaxID=2011161 RepID=A0A914VGX3_9BILA